MTDSLAQTQAYDPHFVLAGTEAYLLAKLVS